MDTWWAEVCEGESEMMVYVVWTQALFLSLYFGVGGAFFVVDLFHKPEFIFSTKLQPKRTYGASGTMWNPTLWTLAKGLAVAQTCVVLPVNMVLYLLATRGVGVWGGRGEAPPGVWRAVGTLVGCVVLEEVLFFYAHWALHSKALYKAVHKKHHEFVAPIALAANYAHPIEVLVGNMIPLVAGPILLSAHITTTWLWFSLAIVGTLVHHSGYDITPAWEAQPAFHDTHHRLFKCNYGLLGVLDRIHGTYRGADAKAL